uniref:Uncharacterized protein n=1 Tax=Romanomermis culicivorax TaxID=13658 RepID=A0A915KDP7_ROMCU
MDGSYVRLRRVIRGNDNMIRKDDRRLLQSSIKTRKYAAGLQMKNGFGLTAFVYTDRLQIKIAALANKRLLKSKFGTN